MARQYAWWVHTVHPEANDAVARALAAHDDADESACMEVLCRDGIRRDMWRCPYGLVVRLKRSPRLRRLVEIFRQSGNGKPERWPPHRMSVLPGGQGGIVRGIPPSERRAS